MLVFIEDMLDEAGLTFSDNQTKQTVIEGIYSKLDEFLEVVLEERLPDDKLAEYFTLLQNQATDPNRIQAFLQANIPDLEQVMASAMLEFREVYLSSIR